MHDPRTSPALASLSDLGQGPPDSPGQWSWSIVRVDDKGRVWIGARAVKVLGLRAAVRFNRLAVVLEPAGPHSPPSMVIEVRQRCWMPAWLRERATEVVVGVNAASPRVLVAPVEVLDPLGDILGGEAR